ncbi:uncharacterized protein [Atheta coriaria]|uniref:uncharacterized protein n=1 Tax=Dalotia coriaria TaxID=877792 RepID=UPI0031F43178
MKFLTGAADPKTPLAMPYFLAEMRTTDGDSTSKTTPGGEQRRLVATKARHLRQIVDLSAAPTVYRETADGREYHDPRKPIRSYQGAKKWPRKNEPAVYKPSAKKINHSAKSHREKEGVEVYNRQQNHFKSRFPELQTPQSYNNDNYHHAKSENYDNADEDEDENEDEEEEEEFVPTRLYAQVRQYETESHLPSSAEEPRLRKIVKDSRVHTVYMEEGYEDGAYDHAGEEKHAEEDEAQVEHRRRRRRHIDSSLTNVEIDTDLIGKNQFALGEANNNADKKYPYYNAKDINSNSPLRYAQAMDDIPQKKEGNMAFYEDAQARTKCDEVVETVAPIPKDLDAGEEAPEKTMVPKLPRLRKLGDKIDCFKMKFFGEQPLDNPLFNEEFVDPPKDLFQEPEVKETENHLKLLNRTGKSFQPLAVAESGFPINSGKLPEEDNEDEDGDTDDAATVVEEQVTAEAGFQPLPEAEALHMRRITRRRKRPYHHNKLYSGRYAAYRPTRKSHPPHKMPRGTTPPTILTSPNVISEVYYKDQIKPSEQLNVFADVINHIQNMSREDSYSSASEQRPHVAIATPASINTKLRTGHRKKLKRKYPVMKSTQQLYTEYMRRSKNNPSRIQDDISPIPQESNVNVGTVQAPKSYGSIDLLSYKNNAETPVHYSTIDMPLNKYLVPGMKPPLAMEKPMIYSDYQSENILKRKDWVNNHRLRRRKRATRNYSEIRRQPASKPQEDPEEEDDNDDYVPHRPTNYHYDPDTDRIIYDKKPTTEKSVEEIVEEYFEEEPEEVTTTKKPPPAHKTVFHKDVLNKANGKTLVDFIALLKSDPSYKPIEDPTTTKEPPSTTTQKAASTTPPEFLKFLDKLHSSEGYKKIDNPEDVPAAKKKPKTTTEAPVEEEEEEEEVVPAGSVQNSPGGQFGPDGGLQIFDINDYLPKVKTYTPRTSIDYSKYKTIERTTSRHNLSSRYSEEDEEPFEKRPTEAPTASKYQTAPPRPKSPPKEEKEDDNDDAPQVAAVTQNKDEEEKEDEVTTTSKPTTTTSAVKIRIRGRQRPTRRPTRTTTTTKPLSEVPTDEVTSDPVENYTPATHRPPSRVYPRRHRPKIRVRSTTTPTSVPVEPDNDEDSSETRKEPSAVSNM